MPRFKYQEKRDVCRKCGESKPLSPRGVCWRCDAIRSQEGQAHRDLKKDRQEHREYTYVTASEAFEIINKSLRGFLQGE